MQDPTDIRISANAAIVKDGKILVIEFDERGIHYNLPGGGIDLGESLQQGLKRECMEEACAEVTVGRLLLVWEYIPAQHGGKYGPRQKLGHIFECQLADGCLPTMPANPDAFQSNVKWIPLSDLLSPTAPPLLPAISGELIEALKTTGQPVRIVDWA